MAHENKQDISNRRSITRFFVEHPHISWMMLVGVLVWGWFGYRSMPQRKDPEIPVRVGVAACPWPGATAEQVEQFVTRRIEDVAAENKLFIPERTQTMASNPSLSPAIRLCTYSWMRV